MLYIQLENKPTQGYTTQLATSDDLLHWKPLGTILDRSPDENAWDHANAGGGLALQDTTWAGSCELHTFNGRYWLSYLGGKKYGYETTPLSIGLASTTDPTIPHLWQKEPNPILTPSDPSARKDLETVTLYKSYIFEDPTKTLGTPFVLFYNAKGTTERIFAATSPDMKPGPAPAPAPSSPTNRPPPTTTASSPATPKSSASKTPGSCSTSARFWKPGSAFNTFAASNDLLHWTKWTGENLVQPSEPYDTPFAHKSWVLKSNGHQVYHFCMRPSRRQRPTPRHRPRHLQRPQTKVAEPRLERRGLQPSIQKGTPCTLPA